MVYLSVINKSYRGNFGFLRKFFACLTNLFQGHGFQTDAKRALKLHRQFMPTPAVEKTDEEPTVKVVDEESLDEAAKADEGHTVDAAVKLPDAKEARLLATNAKNPYEYRQAIYEQTRRACENGYINAKGEPVKIDSTDMKQGAVKYDLEKTTDRISLPPRQHKYKTEFKVTTDDTFNVLLKYKREGANPIGINMANAKVPGGGVTHGALAQEEDLCRRSDHMVGLETQTYPISEFGVIYCPHVSVFREDEKRGFAFMDQPEKVSLVAVAAYSLGKTTEAECRNNKDYTEGTKAKIRNMLYVAASQGHDTLVLGALGCGAFNNPPQLVAELFQQVLQEPELEGRFKVVDFAILCNKPKDNANVAPFRDICQKLS